MKSISKRFIQVSVPIHVILPFLAIFMVTHSSIAQKAQLQKSQVIGRWQYEIGHKENDKIVWVTNVIEIKSNGFFSAPEINYGSGGQWKIKDHCLMLDFGGFGRNLNFVATVKGNTMEIDMYGKSLILKKID